MSQWVVYDHPRDYPDVFVMRRWKILDGVVLATDEVKTAATLKEIRALVPPGLYRLSRFEDDDPCIVEVWL